MGGVSGEAWWLYSAKWFSRPFTRRRIIWLRTTLLLYLVVLFPFCWYLDTPHWWVFPTGFTLISWLTVLVRVGSRRRRQLFGLMPPDDPDLSPEEAWILAGRPRETAQQAWSRARRQSHQ